MSILSISAEARDWYRYETPNFELYSEGRRGDAKSMIHELELFHSIAAGVVGNGALIQRKTRVVLFAKERSLVPYRPEIFSGRPDDPAVGYFAEWLDPLIVRLRKGPALDRLLAPEAFGDLDRWHEEVTEVFYEQGLNSAKRMVGDIPTLQSFALYQEDSSQIILSWEPDDVTIRDRVFRSYVQIMLRSVGLPRVPWFSEGMAEMLKSMWVEHESYIFGMSDPVIVRLMQAINYVMPLEDFMAVDVPALAAQSESDRLAFAAQSWTLIHYGYFGDVHGPQWRSAVLNLLVEVRRGEQDYRALIQKHLGIDPETLARELHAYVQRDKFGGIRAAFPEGWPLDEIDYQKIREEDMTPILAEVKIRLTRSAETMARLDQRIASGVASGNDRYLAGLGRWLADDRSGATEVWANLDDDFPQSALVLRAPAQRFMDDWLAQPRLDVELTEEEAARFRDQLVRALDRDPSDQSTMAYLAWLEALAATPNIENVNLVQRSVGGMIQPELTLLAIAKIRWDMGDDETARTLVYEYHDRDHWPWGDLVDALEEATKLWEHLDERP